MSRRLRIFISSTMKDLPNERQQVCTRLETYNFEPVIAESWRPTGRGTWDRIAREIESCDVFLLVIGERYGWIPDEGPKAELGRSVTHLEYLEARERGLPILAFLKRLDFDDSERDSEDAKKRDAFRKEIGDWAEGQQLAEFELATDLADKVGHALIDMLTDDYLSPKIRARAPAADQAFRLLDPHPDEPAAPAPVELPGALVDAVAAREAVLFAGAGISLAAGLPSAAVFSERLAQFLLATDPGYAVSPVGSAFAAIASDLEATRSREFLMAEVIKLVDLPQGLEPTLAHAKAVSLFDVIVTTNYDRLFEEADSGRARKLIANEIAGRLPKRAIIKLHGSMSDPASLLLTETDVLTMDRMRPRLWRAACRLLRSRPLVVVGSSLRDPSVIRLFAEARPEEPGYFVAPGYFAATADRLRNWNMQCIAATADGFLTSLANAVTR